MKKKVEFTDKGRHLLVVMIIVCIGLMLVTMTSPRIAEPVRTAAGIVVAPFQNGVNEIGKYVTKAFSGFQDVQKLSEENKRKIRENAVKQAGRLCKTGLNTKGAWKRRKPVVCITDGMEFPSIRHASEHYGISQSCISQCVNSIGSTHNLKFRLKSQLEKVKKIV